MSTTSERLFEVAQTLPETLLAEVLDFADFLRTRQTNMVRPADISLASLCGGLENTKFTLKTLLSGAEGFVGKNLQVQFKLDLMQRIASGEHAVAEE